MVPVLVFRVDIGVVIYEAMTPQCGRSVVLVLVVRVDIGVVIYEAMTPQCGRLVVQVLVTYEATTSKYGCQWLLGNIQFKHTFGWHCIGWWDHIYVMFL